MEQLASTARNSVETLRRQVASMTEQQVLECRDLPPALREALTISRDPAAEADMTFTRFRQLDRVIPEQPRPRIRRRPDGRISDNADFVREPAADADEASGYNPRFDRDYADRQRLREGRGPGARMMDDDGIMFDPIEMEVMHHEMAHVGYMAEMMHPAVVQVSRSAGLAPAEPPTLQSLEDLLRRIGQTAEADQIRQIASGLTPSAPALTSEQLLTKTTKPCIFCGWAISKDGGCPHMTCPRCRKDFCWNCLEPYTHHHVERCSHAPVVAHHSNVLQNRVQEVLDHYDPAAAGEGYRGHSKFQAAIRNIVAFARDYLNPTGSRELSQADVADVAEQVTQLERMWSQRGQLFEASFNMQQAMVERMRHRQILMDRMRARRRVRQPLTPEQLQTARSAIVDARTDAVLRACVLDSLSVMRTLAAAQEGPSHTEIQSLVQALREHLKLIDFVVDAERVAEAWRRELAQYEQKHCFDDVRVSPTHKLLRLVSQALAELVQSRRFQAFLRIVQPTEPLQPVSAVAASPSAPAPYDSLDHFRDSEVEAHGVTLTLRTFFRSMLGWSKLDPAAMPRAGLDLSPVESNLLQYGVASCIHQAQLPEMGACESELRSLVNRWRGERRVCERLARGAPDATDDEGC